MRTINSIRNISVSIITQLMSQILAFLNRTIFIYILGNSYLSINGLFSNILSMLSLAELGLGSAIIYNMYKPIAENDNDKVKSLMQLYKKAYNIIGVVVFISSIILVPFLDKIIKGTNNVQNLIPIYLMFLFNSVSSYFFAYKRSIITANQKDYINSINDQLFNLIKNIIQILALILLPNYFLYLGIQIASNLLANVWIARKADKMYPYLKDKHYVKLSKYEKKTIVKHVTATMSHKLGGVVVNSTDNILISSLLNIRYVGIVSNYYMITGMLNTFILQVFNGITASVGNLNASGDMKKSEEVFNKIFFMGFWIYGMCAILLSILFNPFIKLWIGKEYVLSHGVVSIIIINFFLMGMRRATIVYNSTLGLFWEDRYKPWFEAGINLIASIILIGRLGIMGVFLGTLISTVTTSLWFEPFILYKYGFKKTVFPYFIKYLKYAIVQLLTLIITNYIYSFISIDNIIDWIIVGLTGVILINIIFSILLFKTSEFRYFSNIVKSIVYKKKNKSECTN